MNRSNLTAALLAIGHAPDGEPSDPQVLEGEFRWRGTYDFDAAATADVDLRVSTTLVDGRVNSAFALSATALQNKIVGRFDAFKLDFLTETMQVDDDTAAIAKVFDNAQVVVQHGNGTRVFEIGESAGFPLQITHGMDSDLATLWRPTYRAPRWVKFPYPIVVDFETAQTFALRFAGAQSLIGADAVWNLRLHGAIVASAIKPDDWIPTGLGRQHGCALLANAGEIGKRRALDSFGK